MKLREHQAKAVFARYGVATPGGALATTGDEAERAAASLGGPVVLKPQLGVKGRGKVGGIAFADDPAAARAAAARLLGSRVHDEEVSLLLVEQRVAIASEAYLALAIDHAARRPLLMVSAAGGVAIEEVAHDSPEAIHRVLLSLRSPPSRGQLQPVAEVLGDGGVDLVETLYRVFCDHHAEIVEINPVAITPEGALVAVDAVLNIDDNAVRHDPALQALGDGLPAEDELSAEARRQGWTFIDLGGEVAVLSSGAGLTMTIVDMLLRQEVQPANFLDTAQFDEQGIYRAFELLRRARPATVWLCNIFAGLNRCDGLARGIVAYLRDHPLDVPLVVRMVGNLEDEGHRILREAGIDPVRRLERAVEACVRTVRGAER